MMQILHVYPKGEKLPHHFTKSTVEASIYCKACGQMTPWRIADGRRQFCLVCYAKPTQKRAPEKQSKKPEQLTFDRYGHIEL